MNPNAALQNWLDGWNVVLGNQRSLSDWLAGGGFRPNVEVYAYDEDGEEAFRRTAQVLDIQEASIMILFSHRQGRVWLTPRCTPELGPHYVDESNGNAVYVDTVEKHGDLKSPVDARIS